jgi:hypothetical protein
MYQYGNVDFLFEWAVGCTLWNGLVVEGSSVDYLKQRVKSYIVQSFFSATCVNIKGTSFGAAIL